MAFQSSDLWSHTVLDSSEGVPTIDESGKVDPASAAEKAKVEGSSKGPSLNGFRYVLVVHRNGDANPSAVHPLPSVPTAKNIRLIPANELRYTLSDIPIREHSTSRAWAISFRGMTGVHDVGPRGGGGMNRLKLFDQFVHDWHSQAAIDGELYLTHDDQRKVRDRTWLELWDLEDGFGWKVEFRGWDWDRGASTRVKNAEWSIALHGYAPVQNVESNGGQDFMAKEWSTPPDGLAAAPAYQAQGISAAVLAKIRSGGDPYKLAPWAGFKQPFIVAQFDRVQRSISAAWGASPVGPMYKGLQYVLYNYHAVAVQIMRVDNMVQRGATALLDMPRQVLLDTIGPVRATRKAIERLQGLGYEFRRDMSALGRDLTAAFFSLSDLEDSLTATVGRRGGVVPLDLAVNASSNSGSSAMQPTSMADPPGGGVFPYTLGPGDTLENLAEMLFGDPAKWTLLAALNKMSGAATSASGAPLVPGSTLLLPGSVANGIVVPQASSSGDLYGTDFAIDPVTGDRTIDSSPLTKIVGGAVTLVTTEGRDYKLVSGKMNLVQAVSNRMRTARNTVPTGRRYGVLPFEPGTPLGPTQVALLLADVRNQPLQDPRVLRVSGVKASVVADMLVADLQITPIMGGTVGVVTPLL